MAKWSGKIGFGEMVETSTDVWELVISEKHYYGDIIVNRSNTVNKSEINDEISLSNQIRVISAPYACDNYQKIKYITFMKQKWKVNSISIEYPALLITLGGYWNEESRTTKPDSTHNS